MKKIKVDNIVANVRRQQFTKSTHQHYQEAYQEGFEALLASLNVDPNTLTLLSGTMTEDAGEYSITDAWFAYQGEIFECSAVDIGSPSEDAVFVIVETYRAGDPIKFDDGSTHNVHQIRKIALQDYYAGDGVADWGEVEFVADKLHSRIQQSNLNDTNWTDLTLLNGAVDHPSVIFTNSATPGYIKRNGVVYLRGAIQPDSSGHIATLPEGYRPKGNISIPLSLTPSINACAVIFTTGEINIYDADDVVLDLISFPV